MTFSLSVRRTVAGGALLVAVLASAFLGSGCNRLERDRNRADLVAARRQWQALRIVSYDYRYQNQCFCAPTVTAPVVLEVRGGAITGATRVDDGTPLGSEALVYYRTVDDVFALIAEAIDENAAHVDVRYDPARGYPTSVFIDRDERIADEEVRIEASALVPR